MPDTVSYAGERLGRLLFHQELHGKETAGLFKDTGGQPAINGIPEGIAQYGVPMGPLQDQLVHDAFQNQGKKDECPGTNKNGR